MATTGSIDSNYLTWWENNSKGVMAVEVPGRMGRRMSVSQLSEHKIRNIETIRLNKVSRTTVNC